MAGEFGEEHELCPGVSFSETVDGVDFAPVFSETGEEFFAASAAEEVLFRESAELEVGGVGDGGGWVVAIVDRGRVGITGRIIDDVGSAFTHLVEWAGTFFSGPVVDVLEQGLVDGFEVVVVELSGDRRAGQFTHAYVGGSFFVAAELVRIRCSVRFGCAGQLVA